MKLLELIYDKLANNADYEQFEPEMTEDMTLVADANTGEAECIEMTVEGKKYKLTLTEAK